MQPFVQDNLKPLFAGKKILLGITGSIAAFKALDLIRGLQAVGARVRVICTDNALQFVTKTTLETLTGEPVVHSLWSGDETGRSGTHHISHARWGDAAVVAPATANFIAKLTYGLADDALSTELLAFTGPLFVAPAMNPAMYKAAATQENVARLRSRGVRFLGPVSGLTSCGEEGLGRMMEPDDMILELAGAFRRTPAPHHTVLVSLGPTRSALDPVRYLSNRSSGLMGAALCWEAFRRGYDVVAVKGPCDATLPPQTKIIEVETAQEMFEACVGLWPSCFAFLSVAAVLDWDFATTSTDKIKKIEMHTPPLVTFKENPDILKTLSSMKRPGQWVLGFAAETSDIKRQGEAKLRSKDCNFLFINDVTRSGEGFGAHNNSGLWLERNPAGEVIEIPLVLNSKITLAGLMFNRMESHWNHQKSHYKSEVIC